MTEANFTCPQSREEVVNAGFLEHRAKLVDIAAWLDRLDRSRPKSDQTDFRDAAFRQALNILTDGRTHRAKRILAFLSDHTTEMPQSAEGMKGASGAPVSIPSSGDLS